MAGIIQLAAGGSAQAPAGALAIRLSATAAAQIVLTGPSGTVVEPQFRVSATEVVVVPGQELTVGARTATGQPFASGTRLGVSFGTPGGGGSEIVRPSAEVGGQHGVTLAHLSAGGLITDAMADARRGDDGSWARPWLKPGAYAFHVNHQDPLKRDTRWALVLDASASILVEDRRARVGQAVETLIGIVATGFGHLPAAVLLATEPMLDRVEALEADAIDWGEALGHDPAPWPRVTRAVQAAADGGRAVVLLLDGVPVDYRELTAFAADSGTPLLVLAVGRSRFGLRQEDRPVNFWDEELAALDELAALPNVHLAATTDLAHAAAAAERLADALFPRSAV